MTQSSDARAWRLINVLGVTTFAILLLAAYRFFISPLFDYLGYHWQDPDWALLGLTILVIAGLAFMLPIDLIWASDFMSWVVMCTVVIPVLVIGHVIGLLTPVQAMVLTVMVGGSFGLAVWVSQRAREHFRSAPKSLKPKIYWSGLSSFVAVVVALLIAVNGLRLNPPGITDVYEVRDELSTNLAAFPLLSYLFPVLSYFVIPLFIAAGVHRRSITLTGLAVAVQVFVYVQTGFKTFLLGLPVILILSLTIGRRVRGALFPLGLSLGIVISALADLLTGNIMYSSLFTRRFLITPGQLAAYYVDFFSSHRFVWLSETVLSPWVVYPYELPLPVLIGREIHGVTTNFSNVNFWGDGFAQGGWVGLLIAGLVFAAVLIVADWASQGLPVSLPCMLLFLPCIVLSNSSILTALLSHGLAVGLVALALAPREGWSSARRVSSDKNLLFQ